MTAEIFLFIKLSRILLTSKSHHAFGLDVLESLDYLIYQENQMKKWLKIHFIKSNPIYLETIILFRGRLIDWETNMQNIISYCQKNNLTISNLSIKTPLCSIISLTINIYNHLFDQFSYSKSPNKIQGIILNLRKIEKELYILNDNNMVLQVRNINTFLFELQKLIKLIENFYDELLELV